MSQVLNCKIALHAMRFSFLFVLINVVFNVASHFGAVLQRHGCSASSRVGMLFFFSSYFDEVEIFVATYLKILVLRRNNTCQANDQGSEIWQSRFNVK